MILFEIPQWLTGFNFLVGLFGLLVTIGGAYIVILTRNKNDISGLQTDRAVAAESILKIRDIELATARLKVTELEQELEDLTAEHRTLVGMTIGALLKFWEEKEAIEAKIVNYERQIRILKRADGDKES